MSKEALVMNGNGSIEMMSTGAHKWMVRAITLAVVAALVVAGTIVGPKVLAQYRAAIVEQKKADIDMIAQTVSNHVAIAQNVPQNVMSGWCVVGQSYPSGQCLSELSATDLPVSPDKEPYYYYATKNYIVIATKLTPAEDGPGKNVGACAAGYGDTYWCVELDRAKFAQNSNN